MALVDTLEAAANHINEWRSGLPNIVNNPSNGFTVPPIPNGDGTGLPASKVPNQRTSSGFKRDIIHWFVPEFGIVKMYVNPNNIQYRHRKIINKERTKGGYTLQYWGEELTELSMSGTTGSSGVEGINVLNEIYRAEQFAFDSVGLSLASDNAALGAATSIVSGVGNAIGNAIGGTVGGLLGTGIAQGIFGTNNFSALAPRNITSLAQLAFGVEMFYSGQIWRGFFNDMNITETPAGQFDYTINFTSTQRRGYRQNTMPYQRSAIDGPSNNDINGGVPLSFNRLG